MCVLREHRQRSLSQDTRGAVLVLGIGLGCLLVGALWQLVGLAEGIMWRETAQDAADAVAFEHAVWSARGMNVIAMINIVMSLVMFVMVVWRTALIALGIAMLVTLPPGLALLPVVEQMLVADYRFVAPTVIRIEAALNVLEMGVATAAPILATYQAESNTTAAYGGAAEVASVATYFLNTNIGGIANAAECLIGGSGRRSTSRPELPAGTTRPALPGSERPALPPGSTPSRPGSTPGSSTPGSNNDRIPLVDRVAAIEQLLSGRMGMPVSLPVQDDSFSLLCNKGGSFAWNNAAGLMEEALARSFSETLAARPLANAVVLPLDLARNAVGFVTGLLPGVFCAPLGESPISLDGIFNGLPLGDGQVDQYCQGSLNQSSRRSRTNGDGSAEDVYQDPHGWEWLSRNDFLERCRGRARYASRRTRVDRLKNAFNEVSALLPDVECGKPAKAWEYAGNGNVFLRSFGKSLLPASSEAGDRGLEVADGQQAGNVASASARVVHAHAEMYFDCEGPWGLNMPSNLITGSLEDRFRMAVPGHACGPDAMWKMRWQARLRRVHPSDTLWGAELSTILYGLMRQVPPNATTAFSRGQGWWTQLPRGFNNPIIDWISQYWSGWISTTIDRYLREMFGDMLEPLLDGGEDVTVGDVIDQLRPEAHGPDELRQFLEQHRERSATIH